MADVKLPDGFRLVGSAELKIPEGFKLVQDGGKKEYADYQGWGDYAKDFARTAIGQGTALGFGDEITAGVRSVLPESVGGAPYAQALQEERDAVARFRDKNPGTAIAAEIGGGLATPGLGAAGTFINRGGNLASRVIRGAAVGGGLGAVNAVGAVEGNDLSTYRDAIGSGAATGAVIGGAVPAVIAGAQRLIKGTNTVAQNAIDKEAGARLYFADKLEGQNLTPQKVADDLARGKQAATFSQGTAALPETIADVAPVTQRTLRGVKVGGSADDIIEPFLGNRQAGSIDFRKGADVGGQLPRIGEDMRLALRVTDADLADQMASIAGKRSKVAKVAFDAARKASQPFDLSPTIQRYSFEAMNLPDPAQRGVLNRALRYFTQAGQTKGNGGAVFPVDDIDRFHKAKMALDDLLGSQKIKEQGNLYRLLTNLKHDMMESVFKLDPQGNPTINAEYRKALDQFASRSALLNAGELGKAFATGAEPITERMWRAMPEAEKKFVRKAWLEHTVRHMGEKPAGPTTDFTGELRKANTGADLRMLLPPGAGKSAEFPGGNREMLGELVQREHRMSSTSQKVLGNSSTAEKAADAIDIGRLARASRYIKEQGGPMNAVVAALGDTLEKLTAIKGEKARYLAQNLLETDPQKQQAFLQQVQQTYNSSVATQINRALDVFSARIENAATGQLTRDDGKRASAKRQGATIPLGMLAPAPATP